LTIAAASVFVLLPATAGTASADPKVTAAAAAAQLQTLNTKAEILSEKFDAAQDQLSAAQVRLTADQHDGLSPRSPSPPTPRAASTAWPR
jgi:outer membrane murein-binding lipoprotein Lpp